MLLQYASQSRTFIESASSTAKDNHLNTSDSRMCLISGYPKAGVFLKKIYAGESLARILQQSYLADFGWISRLMCVRFIEKPLRSKETADCDEPVENYACPSSSARP